MQSWRWVSVLARGREGAMGKAQAVAAAAAVAIARGPLPRGSSLSSVAAVGAVAMPSSHVVLLCRAVRAHGNDNVNDEGGRCRCF